MENKRDEIRRKADSMVSFTRGISTLSHSLKDIELFFKLIDFQINKGIAEDFQSLQTVDRIIKDLENINNSINYLKDKLDFSKIEILKEQFLNQKKKLLYKELEKLN